MIFKGPASESGISGPSRLGRRLSQMPSAAPRSGSVATRRGPHLSTQVHSGWGTTCSPGTSSAAYSACWRAICQSTSDRATSDASASSQCTLQGVLRPLLREDAMHLEHLVGERQHQHREHAHRQRDADDEDAPQQPVDQALGVHLGRLRRVRQIGHGSPPDDKGYARARRACRRAQAAMGEARARLARALVAAAQLQLALAGAVFQRPRRRAAGIDAAFHAVDLARGRARPAAAALEGARLPLVLRGADVLLGRCRPRPTRAWPRRRPGRAEATSSRSFGRSLAAAPRTPTRP